MEEQDNQLGDKMSKIEISSGIGLGNLIAVIISYLKWKSIGWMILHGLLGWLYVIYYVIKYGWNLG